VAFTPVVLDGELQVNEHVFKLFHKPRRSLRSGCVEKELNLPPAMLAGLPPLSSPPRTSVAQPPVHRARASCQLLKTVLRSLLLTRMLFGCGVAFGDLFG
jgi:hypothetical protein